MWREKGMFNKSWNGGGKKKWRDAERGASKKEESVMRGMGESLRDRENESLRKVERERERERERHDR